MFQELAVYNFKMQNRFHLKYHIFRGKKLMFDSIQNIQNIQTNIEAKFKFQDLNSVSML